MRAAALAVVLGIIAGGVVLVGGCSGTQRCSVSTCAGCCDDHDQCQAGTAGNACGVSGAACVSCNAVQACMAGACAQITGGGGGGGGGGGPGGNGSDGGSGTDGGSQNNPEPDGGTNETLRKEARIFFGVRYGGEWPDWHTDATASFVETASVLPSCSVQTYGPCKVTTCSGGTEGATYYRSAGTLDLLWGAHEVQLPPDSYAYFEPGQGFEGGETVNISAFGAEVPTFNVPLTAPQRPVVQFPPEGVQVTLPRTQSASVTWSGASVGTVIVTVLTPEKSLVCTAAASAGSITIPSSGLSQLPPGPAAATMVSVNEAQVQAGAWPVQVRVQNEAVYPSGNPVAALQLELQ